jgi:hypothetical protein
MILLRDLAIEAVNPGGAARIDHIPIMRDHLGQFIK